MYQRAFDDARPPEMWISDVDGSNARKVTSGNDVSFDWSPDSSWISYNDSNKIYVSRPDGSELHQIGKVDGSTRAILWSADPRTLYVSTKILASGIYSLWELNVDGSQGELLKADTIYPIDVSPDGRNIIGATWKDSHIVQLSVATKEETMLVPDASTSMVRVSEDGKSFIYAIEGGKETIFYRQDWENGKPIGEPEVAVKVPFPLYSEVLGKNSYDFSRDLSTIVYSKPNQQADLYLLCYSQ
jgi:Tol biopolymer transport system component